MLFVETSIVFSPNGKYLAFWGSYYLVGLLNFETGKIFELLPISNYNWLLGDGINIIYEFLWVLHFRKQDNILQLHLLVIEFAWLI